MGMGVDFANPMSDEVMKMRICKGMLQTQERYFLFLNLEVRQA